MQAADAFVVACELLALVFLFHFGWVHYRRDSLRQRLFELRNDLFLYASQNGLSFRDPAYVSLRSRINATIHYSHQIEFTNLLLFGLMNRSKMKTASAKAAKEWEKALAGVGERHAEYLRAVDQKMIWILMKHVALGPSAPIVFVILIPSVSIRLVVRRSPVRVQKKLEEDMRRIETQIEHAFEGARAAVA